MIELCGSIESVSVDRALTVYVRYCLFRSDNMNSDGHQMMVKVAEAEAFAGGYKKAIEHYEKVSEASLEV